MCLPFEYLEKCLRASFCFTFHMINNKESNVYCGLWNMNVLSITSSLWGCKLFRVRHVLLYTSERNYCWVHIVCFHLEAILINEITNSTGTLFKKPDQRRECYFYVYLLFLFAPSVTFRFLLLALILWHDLKPRFFIPLLFTKVNSSPRLYRRQCELHGRGARSQAKCNLACPGEICLVLKQ